MKKTTLIVIVIIIAAVIAAIALTAGKSSGSTKYVAFSKCLKDAGAQFYGAFWCPHCQAQEKDFEMSRQDLESEGLYNECSTADGQSQLQKCTDIGVESYPTWTFTKPIVVTATTDPLVCPTTDKLTADSSATCKQIGSAKYTTYVFAQPGDSEEVEVQTLGTPVHTDSTWTFDEKTSHTSGGLSLNFLAAQTSCTLPQ